MALKRKLTKEEFEKLSKDLKTEYTASGDEYVLDVEGGLEDPDELRRARDREKQSAKDLKKKLKEAEDKLAALDDDDSKDDDAAKREKARKKEDAKKIDEAWKTKHETAISEKDAKLSKSQEFIKKQLINGTSERLANKISTMPTLMAKTIAERFSVEFPDDGEPTLKILDAQGKPSNLTIEQLEKEIVANKEFAPILTGSKASGGSAPRQGSQQPAVPGNPTDKPASLATMPDKEFVEHLKAVRAAQTP